MSDREVKVTDFEILNLSFLLKLLFLESRTSEALAGSC